MSASRPDPAGAATGGGPARGADRTAGAAEPPRDADCAVLHATTVAIRGRALLIQGPSGAGKSALALALMAHGAGLVADDRTALRRSGGGLVADAPDAVAGLIEARGIGLLNAPAAGPTPVAAAVDLGRTETGRLPPPRETRILGVTLPLLHAVASPHFAAALLHYMHYGLSDR